MRSVKVLLAIALLLGSCTFAQAAVLIDQAMYTNSASAQRSYTGGSANYGMADDFTLSSNATIESVSVRGSFAPHAFWGGSLQGLTVSIYSGSSLSGATLVSSQTMSSFTLDGDLYSTTLNSGVALSAGTTYWIAIQGVTSGDDRGEFYVRWANDVGTGGGEGVPATTVYVPNGAAAVTYNGGTVGGSWGRQWDGNFMDGYSWKYSTSYTYQAVDLAFSLSGTATGGGPEVPEPSSLVLLAAGVVGLLAYAWRKRK